LSGTFALARNVTLDEQPCTEANSEAIGFRAASELFSDLDRPVNTARLGNMGKLVELQGAIAGIGTGPTDPFRKYVLRRTGLDRPDGVS